MPKLKLSDWASISEIIASVVIVLSLIYLAFELNQNTKALQQGSYQSTMDRLGSFEMVLASQEDLADIYSRAENNPSQVSPMEWFRYSHFMMPRFGEWEYLYLSRQEDAISEIQWSAFEAYFLEMACKPGNVYFWNENRLAWSPAFKDYVELQALAGCK